MPPGGPTGALPALESFSARRSYSNWYSPATNLSLPVSSLRLTVASGNCCGSSGLRSCSDSCAPSLTRSNNGSLVASRGLTRYHCLPLLVVYWYQNESLLPIQAGVTEVL